MKNIKKIYIFLLLILLVSLIGFKNTSAYTAGAFVTTWKTDNPGTSSSNQITIPTNSNYIYNYNVDWGDGNNNTGVTGNITHTYAVAGTYTVEITGTFPQIYFSNTGDRRKILTVEQWGDIIWSSMERSFMACSNLTIPAVDAPDLSNVTSMNAMFNSATSFNQSINHWNVSNVTDMSGAFQWATSFNQPLNSWNVSNVTTMQTMFSYATSFNQDLSSWNVSNVTTMIQMFYNATSFNQDLSSWNVSNVTNMDTMFYEATAFNQELSSWDVSNVTDMGGMFYGTPFNQPLNSWDVSNVTNMVIMFYGTPFNQPLNSWDVSSVTDMRSMFGDDTAFNQDLSSWNVSNVTDMSYMFSGSTSFNQDLSSWDVSSVTDMRSMFSDDTAFNQDLSSWNVSNVTDMSYMFSGSTSFNQDLSSWDVSNVTNMGGMFYGTPFNQDLSSWNVSNVTDMSYMFSGATSFNQDLSSWNVSNVTDMSYMFQNASSFNQDLSSWDVSSVGDMSSMFYGVTLSTENYDSILNSWSFLSLQSDVSFDGGDSLYICSSTRRQDIIDTYNWSITDGGLDSDPVSCEAKLFYLGNFIEDSSNDGSINGSRIINLIGDTFILSGDVLVENTHYTLTNKPAGLTSVMTVNGDGDMVTLTFTGNAINHKTENSVSSLTITFLDGAFTNTAVASDVVNYTNSLATITFTNAGISNEITVLHEFEYDGDSGIYPNGGNPDTNSLVLDSTTGLLYGTTPDGGVDSAGVIFSYNSTGDQYTLLYEFEYDDDLGYHPNGANPYSFLTLDSENGLLYGMTSSGGVDSAGVIFSYNPTTDAYTMLYEFEDDGEGNYPNGSVPQGSLTLDSETGLLYGMTSSGGVDSAGVIFSYNPTTDAYTMLYEFEYDDDLGYHPNGGHPDLNSLMLDITTGLLYGMTSSGGVDSAGVIFSYNPTTDAYTMLYEFEDDGEGNYPNGSVPQGSLTLDSETGLLYGMTSSGGVDSAGVIFSYNPTTDAYTMLYEFEDDGEGNHPNGSLLYGSLALDLETGLLYGMTVEGGVDNVGVIFSYNSTGDQYTLLYEFEYDDDLGYYSNGANPTGSLTLDSENSLLYGMTSNGGENNNNGGVIFSFILSQPPIAEDVSISGNPYVGQTLTGSYTYSDVNNDTEGISTFKWYRGVDEIVGATSINYTLTAEDVVGSVIKFEVTPVALAGDLTGTAVLSDGITVLETPAEPEPEPITHRTTGSYLPEVWARMQASAGSFVACPNGTIINNKCVINLSSNNKYLFTKLLKSRIRDTEVKELQKYLNNNNYPLTLTGLGSKGNETDYFGPLTLKAVKLFQQANNLVVDGIVGPKTRGVLNK